MKLFLMTDLEGVAGVLNGRDWLYPTGSHYETATRLLTEEVNAAVEAFAGGFDEIVVSDGHGAGAIKPKLLDPRATYFRASGPAPYPFGLDRSFNAAAYVGQHAKAGTPYSHLTHTGWWNVRDERLNGISIGEYGEGAFCAGELGVPMIFASGEKAFCAEVAALTPWVVTASVLEGTIGGTGNELSGEDFERFHEGARHLPHADACALIHDRARQSLTSNHELLTLAPPYRLERDMRAYRGAPAETVVFEHPDSIIAVFNSRCV